jgi:NAD(P)-dependent dehydrogenase (short-subunit alcohol dehydrogenase family)
MRTALVTGATEGVGRALSAALAGAGHRVIVTARDAADAEATAATLPEARGLRLDVSSDDDLGTLAERAGAVDVLVNCAGVLLDRDADPLTLSPRALEQTLRVNLLGPWRVCQALVPGMVERGWGRVVNVSSGAGSFTRELWTVAHAYSASKVALNAFTVNLARRLHGTGVLVNAADPGVVRTRMSPAVGRSVEEAAAGMLWLCTLPDGGPSGGFFADGEPVGW